MSGGGAAMKAIITIGASASGKTTWAEEFAESAEENYFIVSRDDFRFPDGNRDYYNYKFKKSKENQITEQCEKAYEQHAAWSENIIVCDTNINPKRTAELMRKLSILGYEVETKLFDVPLDELIRRDNQRKGGVGQSVIMRQWLQLSGQKYTQTDGVRAYVFDIDGTLAINDGYRGFFEWEKVGNDKPNTHVIEVAKSLHKSGYELVVLSGRDGSCEHETRVWLNKHIGTDYSLFMRKEGDMRKDHVIKEELFFEHIHDEFYVMGVFDDRPQVIKNTWLRLGINVFSVGNPYIDF
jgi:predicted kinase